MKARLSKNDNKTAVFMGFCGGVNRASYDAELRKFDRIVTQQQTEIETLLQALDEVCSRMNFGVSGCPLGSCLKCPVRTGRKVIGR